MSITNTENDFEFYLKFAKPLVLNLVNPSDRAVAAAWVQKLRDNNLGDLKLRTEYLKLLLFVLQRKRLIGIFAENPSQIDKLEELSLNLHDVAKDLLNAEEEYRQQKIEAGLTKAAGDHPPYFAEFSADLLEYSAAQEIPNFGVHAYYAISNEPLQNWNKTENIEFPRGVCSSTEKDKSHSQISKISTLATEHISEPVVREQSKHRSRSKSKDKYKPVTKSGDKSRDRSKDKSSDKSQYTPKKDKADMEVGLEVNHKSTTLTVEAMRSPSPKKRGPPSLPLGSMHLEDEEKRTPPTWGSNLIGVSEPPLRDITTDILTEEDRNFLQSIGSSEFSKSPKDQCEPCSPKYSPQLPQGDRSVFFLESPPGMLDQTPETPQSSTRGSSGYPSLPYKTPSPKGRCHCSPSYSPQLPPGDRSAFFLESPPGFLDQTPQLPANSTRGSSGYQSLPNQTQSPQGRCHCSPSHSPRSGFATANPTRESSGYPSLPYKTPSPKGQCHCSPAYSPQFDQTPSFPYRTPSPQRPQYSPQLPSGNESAFFLESPPPYLNDSPSNYVSPCPCWSSQAPPTDGQYDWDELQALGLNESAFRTDVFQMDDLDDFDVDDGSMSKSFKEDQIGRRSIDDDLDAYDRMIAEYEDDEYGGSPPSPHRSPNRSPANMPRQSPRMESSSRPPSPYRSPERVSCSCETSDNKKAKAPKKKVPCRTAAKKSSQVPSSTTTKVTTAKKVVNKPSDCTCGSKSEAPSTSKKTTTRSVTARPRGKNQRVQTSNTQVAPKSSRPPLATSTQTKAPKSFRAPLATSTQTKPPKTSRMPTGAGTQTKPSGSLRSRTPCNPCPSNSRVPPPGRSQVSGPAASKKPAPAGSRIPCPGRSQVSIPGGSRISGPGGSRIPAPGPERSQASIRGGSRISGPGGSRIPAPGPGRSQASITGGSRIPAPGGSRIPCPGRTSAQAEVSRIPSSGLSRVPVPKTSRIPQPGISGIPGPRGSKTSKKAPCPCDVQEPAPYSPALPLGDEEPFFLEAPPSFLYESTLPDVSGSSGYPSLPYRSPPCGNSRGASQSPAGSRRSSPKPIYDADQLQDLGLQPGDLDDDVFNLEGIDDINISQISITSDIEYETPSDLKLDDDEMNAALDEYDRQIAALEAENAEDFAQYGSPQEKSPCSCRSSPPKSSPRSSPRTASPSSPIATLSTEPLVMIPPGSAASQDIIDAANRQIAKSPRGRSPHSTADKSLQSFEEHEQQYGANVCVAGAMSAMPDVDHRVAQEEANRQYQELVEKGALQDEYDQYIRRCQQRRPNMPATPPIFSKYRRAMNEREYQPEEFGESADMQWEPGEQFFAGRQVPTNHNGLHQWLNSLYTGTLVQSITSPCHYPQTNPFPALSPRGDVRGSGVERLMPGLDRNPQAERFFDEQAEPDSMQEIDNEFEQSAVHERSPSPVCEDLAKLQRQIQTELNEIKATTPAVVGLPVTTPQRTPSPRRPGKSIRVEEEGGEVSFEMPPYESSESDNFCLSGEEAPTDMFFSPPTRSPPISPPESPTALRHRLYNAREPNYYSQEQMSVPTGSTRSRGRVIERKSPAPSLNKVRELPPDYSEEHVPFLSRVEAADGWNRRENKRMRIAKPGMERVLESPMVVPYVNQVGNANLPPDDSVCSCHPASELDRSLPEGLPSPLRPPTVVQGWSTPPHLKAPRTKRTYHPQVQTLPTRAENVAVRRGLRDIGQERPPENMSYSPPPLSPGDYAQPCSGSPSRRSPLFNIPEDAELGMESPPQGMAYSPCFSPRTPPRGSPSPNSSPESPMALKLRLYNAGEPEYYSQEQMTVPAGRTSSGRKVMQRRSPAPCMHGVRELPPGYGEEHVPFLSQVEAAGGWNRRAPKRMQIAQPEMERVLESPMAPQNDPTGLRHIRQSIADHYEASPPENTCELDRSLPGGLPSPMRPPTTVPGWSTPPHLRAPPPSRAHVPPPLPSRAENVSVRRGLRDVIGQERPPEHMGYSPPPLSPGDYPSQSPCSRSRPSPRPGLFDTSVGEAVDMESPPPGMAYSPCFPPRTPPRGSPSPISSPESPMALKLRLYNAGEPKYYSQEQMHVPTGRTSSSRKVMQRRSPAPCLHGVRELPQDYDEEHVPFLSQVEAAGGWNQRSNRRMNVAEPGMETVFESPTRQTGHKKTSRTKSSRRVDVDKNDPSKEIITEVTETEETIEPGDGLNDILQNLERRYADLPELPRVVPEDLLGSAAPVDWQDSCTELDQPLPGDLPSPIKPPTVVPGWSTPPHLKKQVKQPSPYEFKLQPPLRDVLFHEGLPPGWNYSPDGSPQNAPVKRSRTIKTEKRPRHSTPPSCQQPITKPSPMLTPRSPGTPSWQAGGVFDEEPQFLAVEMPPDEFMPAGSPTDRYSPQYIQMPSPDDTVDSFESHEQFFAQSPTSNLPFRSPVRPPDSPTKQMRKIKNAAYQQYSQLESPAQGPAPPLRSPEELAEFEMMERICNAGAPKGSPCQRHQRPPYLPQQQIDEQYADLYETDKPWLVRVEELVSDVPDPHLIRKRPLVSSPTGWQSPEYSPVLPDVHGYSEQLEDEFVPESVWGYQSPKSPPKSPEQQQPLQPINLFDVCSIDDDEYLDQMTPPQYRSPTSPPTPPRVDDYYAAHTPPSPGSPEQLTAQVGAHQYTPHHYDKGRRLMSSNVRVKNRVMPISRRSRPPPCSPIREGYREPATNRGRVPQGELIPVTSEEIMEEVDEIIEEYPEDEPPLLDRAVPQVGLPCGFADPGLNFRSPPRVPRQTMPSKYAYVPGPQYKDELAYQSPPQFYRSPDRDIFEEAGPAEMFEATPPRGYGFSPPPLSPEQSPYSPYMGFTPPDEYTCGYPCASPIDSPGFGQSIREHQYTDRFFEQNRPKVSGMVRSGNRVVPLRRKSSRPPLPDIEERYHQASPERYALPQPCYYGSPGREFIRTPMRREPMRQNVMTVTETDEPEYYGNISDRIPFAGQPCGSPDWESPIPADLDASFLEEEMCGFRWMG